MYEIAGAREGIAGYPPQAETLEWFLARAPEELAVPESFARLGPGPLPTMRVSKFRPAGAPPTPAVSFLAQVSLFDERGRDLLVCDMRHGLVLVQQLYLPGKPFRQIARVPNPGGASVVDLDGDGIRDLLVANLGSINAGDHDRGSVVWLRGLPGHSFEAIPILEKLGRVADVQAADLDGDGDLDLAVAVFGWRNTGQVLLLENRGGRDPRGAPRFESMVLDHRPGAMNIPIVDLDRDGRPDLVVVFSQQFETVVAFLNRGGFDFELKTLYTAPHPDWGCTQIEVVDLERDGDLDVLLAAGDTIDTNVLKTYQGVTWLENRGEYPFTAHFLASLPGAHRTRTADIDGDGDLDIFASVFLPQFLMDVARKPLGLESIIWLEQKAPGKFERHSLEVYGCDHPSLEVGDFDGDGDIDLVAGNFVLEPEILGTLEFWVTVFENLKH